MKNHFLQIRFNLIVIVLSLIPLTLYSQEQGSEKNSLVAGAWAAQFQIQNNFTLGQFQGYGLAFKHHYTRNSAVRLAWGFNLNSNNSDNLNQTLPADTIRNTSSGDNNGFNFSMKAFYLYYMNPDGEVNLFLGGGPIVNVSHNKNETDQENVYGSRSNLSHIINESNGWGFGLGATLGVEWFATHAISLHTEYFYALQYNHSKNTTDQLISGQSTSQHSELTQSGFSTSVGGVSFGLSAYF